MKNGIWFVPFYCLVGCSIKHEGAAVASTDASKEQVAMDSGVGPGTGNVVSFDSGVFADTGNIAVFDSSVPGHSRNPVVADAASPDSGSECSLSGEACGLPSDCCEGATCGTSGVCFIPLVDGQPCTRGEDCETGECNSAGTCGPLPSKTACIPEGWLSGSDCNTSPLPCCAGLYCQTYYGMGFCDPTPP